MVTTIKIRRWDNNEVIFSHTCENNTMEKTLGSAIYLNVNLTYVDLSHLSIDSVDFMNVDLSHANLSYSIFYRCNFSNANLKGVNLAMTALSCNNLSDANLSYANLKKANIVGTILKGTNLTEANLSYANLSYANLNEAVLTNVKGLNNQCPKKGSFIGWKKCHSNIGPCIVKLEIPADAKRCSGTTNKCRCSKAKVLEIQNLKGNKTNVKIATSAYDRQFKYHVNNIVEEPNFDDRFWVECSNGIHFFMNREDTVNYLF